MDLNGSKRDHDHMYSDLDEQINSDNMGRRNYHDGILHLAIYNHLRTTPETKQLPTGKHHWCRYLNLLKDGAKSWPLDAKYCEWLDSLSSVHQDRRDIR